MAQDLGNSVGYIAHNRSESTISITSRPAGTLSIRSSAQKGHLLDGLCCKINDALLARHMEFYRTLMSSLPFPQGAQPLPGAVVHDLPDDVAEHTPLLAGLGEQVIALLNSDNVYQLDSLMEIPMFYMLSCGKAAALVEIGKMCTCGFRPIEATQHAMVTTHRVVGLVSFKNECSVDCLTPKFKLFYWAPVSRMSGIKLHGLVTQAADCCTRNCPGPCCSAMTAESLVAVRVDGQYPVIVSALDFMASKTGGMLDHANVLHFQRNVALMTAQREMDVNTGPGSPYYFHPGMEQFAGGGGYGSAASRPDKPLLAPIQVTIEEERVRSESE